MQTQTIHLRIVFELFIKVDQRLEPHKQEAAQLWLWSTSHIICEAAGSHKHEKKGHFTNVMSGADKQGAKCL